jgi:Uma2 family endonuclease
LLKPRVYARAGIVEYWVVDTVKRQIEVFAEPAPALTPPRYRRRQNHPRRDSLPFKLDGRILGHVSVADVFPARAR